MKKERIKSIVLILLIFSNIMLTEKILVNKKLWLPGYNFFSNKRNILRKSGISIAGNLAVPQKIIVNTGYQSSRFDYNRSDNYFGVINDTASNILKSAFKGTGKSVSQVSADDWYTALSAKSVYLVYPCKYSAQIFSEFLGLSSTEMNFESFSDIVISESGNIYISDNNAFYKISASSTEISPLIRQALEDHENEESVINYSFDLNFDKDFGDQKTFISPMTLIYSSPIETQILDSVNPLYRSDGEINNKTIQGILSAFSINPNTVRRYTEADGSLVFVENNGILKISLDGILKFTASNTGIKLRSSASQNVHSDASTIATFVDNVNYLAGIQTDMLITSNLNTQGIKNFTFDYIACGLPVKYSDKSSVSAVMSNGYLIEYTQVLRHYISTNKTDYMPTYIETLDDVIAKYQDSMQEIRINDIFPAYIDDLSYGLKNSDWYIDINNIISE